MLQEFKKQVVLSSEPLQEHKEMKTTMTVSQILSQIGKKSTPFVLSRALQIAINSVVLSWFGNTDSDRQSAVSSIAYMQAGKSIIAMFLYSLPIVVQATSNNLGYIKGNFLRKAWLLALPLSAIGVTISYTSQYTLPLLQQPAETVNITQRFLYPYAAGFPLMLSTIAAQLTVLVEDPNTVFLLTLVNEPIIPISYLLMSDMKETGLGMAYFISSFTHFCSYLLVFKLRPQYQGYNIFNFEGFFQPDPQFWVLVEHGIPIGLYAMLELGSVIFSNMLIIQEGEDNATALFPASQISSFMSNFFFALALTLSMLVRAAIKDQRYGDAKKIANVGAGICLTIATVMTGIFLAAPNSLIQPFLGNSISESVDTLAKQFMLSVLLYEFADSLRNNFMCALWGLEKTAYSTKANAAAVFLINAPGALVSKFAFNWESAGILPSRGVSILASALLILRKWWRAIAQENQNHDLEMRGAPLLSHTASDDKTPTPEQKSTGGWFNSWCGYFSGWTRVRSDTGRTNAPSFGNE